MGWTSPEAQNLFRQFLKYDADRRQRECLRVSESLQTLPTTQKVRDDLALLGPGDVEASLRKHPGYATERKITSVKTMLDLFRRALADLYRAIELFPNLGTPDQRAERETLEHDVSVLVNKELFAALGAAKTLVDYSRRIKELIDPGEFESRRKQAFSPQQHALILDLRNLLLHQVHSEANWQKVYRGGPATTHFVIDREDLLADGDLSSAARKHLVSLGEKIDVTDLLSAYAQKVETFYGWLLPEVESRLPLAVADYRACRQAVKVQHGRLSYGFLVKTWTNAGIDPYEHLSKHLTSIQLEAVDALTHRSAEQVDYIIHCVDRNGVCDETLRRAVYELFRVKD